MAFDPTIMEKIREDLIKASSSYAATAKLTANIASSSEKFTGDMQTLLERLEARNSRIEDAALQRQVAPTGIFGKYSDKQAREIVSLTKSMITINQELTRARNFVGPRTEEESAHAENNIRNLEQLSNAYGDQINDIKGFGPVARIASASLVAFASSVLSAISIIKSAGASYAQQVDELGRSIFRPFQAFARGQIVSPSQDAEARASFGKNQLLLDVPAALQASLDRMATAGGDMGAASQLSYNVYQMTGWSADIASEWMVTSEALARANKIPLNQMLQKSAENTFLLANAANQSAVEFGKAVVNAERLGVSIRTIEGVADRFTSDFETFLTAQAKIQTVLPGVDLTGVLQASQFGSDDQIRESITQAFQGRDISLLPRSVANMVASSMGLSRDELHRIVQNLPSEMQIQENMASDIHDIRVAMTGGLIENVLSGDFLKNIAGRGMSAAVGPVFRAIGNTLKYLFYVQALRGSGLGGIFGSGLGGMFSRRAAGVALPGSLAYNSVRRTAGTVLRGGAATAGRVGMLGRIGAGIGAMGAGIGGAMAAAAPWILGAAAIAAIIYLVYKAFKKTPNRELSSTTLSASSFGPQTIRSQIVQSQTIQSSRILGGAVARSERIPFDTTSIMATPLPFAAREQPIELNSKGRPVSAAGVQATVDLSQNSILQLSKKLDSIASEIRNMTIVMEIDSKAFGKRLEERFARSG